MHIAVQFDVYNTQAAKFSRAWMHYVRITLDPMCRCMDALVWCEDLNRYTDQSVCVCELAQF